MKTNKLIKKLAHRMMHEAIHDSLHRSQEYSEDSSYRTYGVSIEDNFVDLERELEKLNPSSRIVVSRRNTYFLVD